MDFNTTYSKSFAFYDKTLSVIRSCETSKQLEGAYKFLNLAWMSEELSLFEYKRLRGHFFTQIDNVNTNKYVQR